MLLATSSFAGGWQCPSALEQHRALLPPLSLRAVSFQKLSSQELIPEASQEPALEAPSKLSWLLEQHEGVETCITCSKSTLQQHGER